MPVLDILVLRDLLAGDSVSKLNTPFRLKKGCF